MTEQKAPTPKQSALIAGLLSGRTVEQAAEAAGVSPSTAFRWLRDPTFTAALAEARREAITRALDILTAGARAAAGEVLALMRPGAGAAPPAVRLRAAALVLDKLEAWVAISDLDNRLKALEEAANAPKE